LELVVFKSNRLSGQVTFIFVFFYSGHYFGNKRFIFFSEQNSHFIIQRHGMSYKHPQVDLAATNVCLHPLKQRTLTLGYETTAGPLNGPNLRAATGRPHNRKGFSKMNTHTVTHARENLVRHKTPPATAINH
jgi:hypothetical protein